MAKAPVFTGAFFMPACRNVKFFNGIEANCMKREAKKINYEQCDSNSTAVAVPGPDAGTASGG